MWRPKRSDLIRVRAENFSKKSEIIFVLSRKLFLELFQVHVFSLLLMCENKTERKISRERENFFYPPNCIFVQSDCWRGEGNR